MNFYKHHIGDYAAATAHLSILEDGVYSRLLRIYYRDEKPLPADARAVQRLVGARTRDEREAVQTMLEEFFSLEADGWHNKRADEELERWRAQAEQNRRIAEEREARKRARTANATSTNRAGGEHESSDEACNESSASREPSQKPEARSQKEATADHREPVDPDPLNAPLGPRAGTDAGLACRLMRDAGCTTTNPSHPELIAALAEGATPEQLADTVREAVAAGVRKPFAWAIATTRGRLADAARPIPGAPNGTRTPSRRLSAADRVLENIRAARERDAAGDVIDGEAFRLAR